MIRGQSSRNHSKDEIDAALAVIDDVVQSARGQIDHVIEPVRQGFVKRFPITFALLVTLGVTATILGLEQILEQAEYLHERPWLLLMCGMILLSITGTLYKKLG